MGYFTEWLIGLIVGRECAEQHIRWRLKQEQDHIRSQSPTKPIPITLHAAKYKESLTANVYMSNASTARGNANSSPPILMPDPNFRNVHSHYITGPVTVKLPSTTTVPSTNSTTEVPTAPIPVPSPTKTKHAQQPVQTNLRQHRKGPRVPRRKRTDLENLPALSSAVAAEMAQLKVVADQAVRFAEFRQKRELKAELARRERMRRKYPVPEYVTRIDRYHGEILTDHLPSLNPKSAASPKRGRERPAQPQRQQQKHEQGAIDVPGNPEQEKHVRWAKDLVQRQQQHFHVDGTITGDTNVTADGRDQRRQRSVSVPRKMVKGG